MECIRKRRSSDDPEEQRILSNVALSKHTSKIASSNCNLHAFIVYHRRLDIHVLYFSVIWSITTEDMSMFVTLNICVCVCLCMDEDEQVSHTYFSNPSSNKSSARRLLPHPRFKMISSFAFLNLFRSNIWISLPLYCSYQSNGSVSLFADRSN